MKYRPKKGQCHDPASRTAFESHKKRHVVPSLPVKELRDITGKKLRLTDIKVNRQLNLSRYTRALNGMYMLKLNIAQLRGFGLTLGNNRNDQLLIGFDAIKNEYFIDRTKTVKTYLHKGFAARFSAPRISKT